METVMEQIGSVGRLQSTPFQPYRVLPESAPTNMLESAGARPVDGRRRCADAITLTTLIRPARHSSNGSLPHGHTERPGLHSGLAVASATA